MSRLALSAFLLASLLTPPLLAQPSIDWSTRQVRSVPDTSFRGLVLDGFRIEQIYPLHDAIFFERESVRFPERVVSYQGHDPSGFSDTTIPGGTMEKYKNVLNIVGVRMRRYPSARLTLTGCSSDEPRFGENAQLARRRAEAVRDYLVSVFGIDSARLRVAARLLPTHPSRPDDELGREDNRRVEFLSDDPRMADVIFERAERWFYEPDSVALRVSNNGLDSLVLFRAIRIERKGMPWHTIPLALVGDTTVVYNWGYEGDADLYPLDTQSYRVGVTLLLSDGRRLLAETMIPVYKYTKRDKCVNGHWSDPNITINEYNLIVFPYDDATATALHKRIINEYVHPYLASAETVECTGHTDRIGEEEYNLSLSRRRAHTVGRLIKQERSILRTATLSADGVGENNPLYTNELPEGRMLNRTVNVRVVSLLARR